MVNFTGFIKFLHLLLNAATDTKVKDQAFLFNELNKYKLISKRDWLTEKISELNKQKRPSDVSYFSKYFFLNFC